MKLYIPRLGDVLILSKDWSFKLYREYRNDSLFNYLNLDKEIEPYREIPYKFKKGTNEFWEWRQSDEYRKWVDTEYQEWSDGYSVWLKKLKEISYYPITLSKGTKLKVDRIFIRKGAEDFDSVTFNIVEIDGKKSQETSVLG